MRKLLLARCPIAASAGPILWTLSGVGLPTGAVANGAFDFNPDTGAFSSINETITGGSRSFRDATYSALAANPPFDSIATVFFS